MKDLYSEITNGIIEQLEQGIIPWKKPWTGINTGAISHATGRAYSLLNQMLLRRPGEYITFNQCKQEGGKVKKGAKSKIVVFWKMLLHEKKDAAGNVVKDADGKTLVEGVPVLRYFQVFHIEDCEGIAPKWDKKLPDVATADERAENILTEYVRREGIRLENVIGDRAYYSPSMDYICLPLMEQFDSTGEYYGTAFHEATHSTGHATRLNRFESWIGAAAFGSDSYSKEELVAEIGAACCLHELGLETPSTFKNSAAYIQSWLRALKDDKRLIISAAARAEKAVKLIFNITDNKQADGE